ncbi:MAG: TRAP transporter substrate-binding protein [Lautropia sp.]
MDHARRRITTGMAAAGATAATAGVAGLGLGGLVGIPSRVHAQAPIKLSLGHNSPPSSPKGLGASKFAELVAARSDGRIAVQVAPAEQLGNENSQMGALRVGSQDLGSLGQGAMLSIVPEVAVLGLPFLYSTMPKAWEALDGPVGQELAKKIEEKNLVFLGWWCNGIRHTTNNKRPITRPEDFKGLKIRTPLDPTTVDTFAAMGASPQQINYGELYMALQKGVVDGQENPFANIYTAKLYEVQKYISFTSHKYEPTGLIMSAIAWKRLKPADQDAIRAAAKEATAYQRRASFDSEEKYLLELKKMPSLALNDVDLAPFRQATESVWDAWEKKPVGDFVKRLRATRA